MRTFTFSSEDRRWLLTWLLTLVLLLGLGYWYERFLQSRNFTPSVDVTADLWSWQRAQRYQDQVVALVGASRIQLAVDPEVLSAQLGGRPVVPLPVSGQYPMSTLKHLAEDEGFKGTVLLSFVAQMLEPRYQDMQAVFNQHHLQVVGPVRHWNARVKAWLQSGWRVLHPLLRWPDLLPYLWQHSRFPDAFYLQIHPDTTASANFDLVNQHILRERFLQDKRHNYQHNPPMDEATWLAAITTLEGYIQRIESRGGAVVVIRFPVGAAHWQLDQSFYPRSRYWEVFRQQLPAVKAIHLMDESVFRRFQYPDSSHLDQMDKPVFSTQLARLLKRQWPALF